jgi:hypothetical protein
MADEQERSARIFGRTMPSPARTGLRGWVVQGVGGQTVRVTTRARGMGPAQPFIVYYYVAEPDPATAKQLVAKHL